MKYKVTYYGQDRILKREFDWNVEEIGWFVILWSAWGIRVNRIDDGTAEILCGTTNQIEEADMPSEV